VTYCIDTSSLMHASQRHYPMDTFPTFWAKMEGLVSASRIVAPDEVLREVEKKDDVLKSWCKKNGRLFHPLDQEVQTAASEILDAFPRLVDDRPEKGQADPFVVALARQRDLVVVTQESPTKSNVRCKIPEVCKHYKVKCIPLLELIRTEKWTF
jgi:Domain of unknown function (DUF4411)